MATYTVLAIVTNEGKQRLAEALATGKSFKIDTFALTGEGHDTSNPVNSLTPDPSRQSCMGDPNLSPLFEDVIDGYSYSGTFCPTFQCTVDYSEAVGSISSICLIGTIVYSPTPNDPEVGTKFLFAYGNMPLWVKTAQDTRTWEVTLHF